MGRRRALILLVVCAAALGGVVFVANNVYWGATPNAPYDAGTVFLFHDTVPEPYGHWLWVSMKPLLALAVALTAWALFRCVRVWTAARPAGVCAKCGYDLRATPDRCPECGTTVPAPATTGKAL